MLITGLLLLLASAPARAADPIGVALDARQRADVARLVSVSTGTMMYDSELGWTMRPSVGRGDYRNNSAGLRGGREFAAEPAPGVLRAAAFGDWPRGAGLRSTETWQALLSSADARIEILDYGVPAYGLDQDFLRYRREGERFHPRVVLISFPTQCLNRNLMTFRPYWNQKAGMPFSKPRFVLEDGRLVLIPNPLAKIGDYAAIMGGTETWPAALGAHDWFYHARASSSSLRYEDGPDYKPDAEGFRVVAALFSDFSAEVRRRGAVPLIVVFPDADVLDARLKKEPPRDQPLLDEIKKRGLDFVDLAEVLTRKPPSSVYALFAPEGGYSTATNALIADELRRRLAGRFPEK